MRYKKNRRHKGGPIGPHSDRGPGKPTGLAGRIVRKRIALGWSQERTARHLGVHRTTLAQWELGREPRGLYAVVLGKWLAGKKE